jgi:single-stranded-DNA-specific exonuclease
MSTATWNLLRPSPDAVGLIERELGVSRTLASVLVNRGAADPETAARFLRPSLAQLHDPLAMRGMTDAVFTVARAVREGRRILIWGDYDVDGVTGTVLLVDFLRRHTPAVSYHIPHRTEDGYGLDAATVRRFAADGVSLIVTVDCGISNVEEVREARGLGVDVVVTDHHEPPARLPRANAVLNPRRPGCRYPFKSLAGVGIAFKLAQALARLIGPGPRPGGDELLLSYLDMVALGTVADIAPLVGENRVLVSHGLEVLGSTSRPGVRALLQTAGIETRPLRAAQIGFGLGPRINAAGRLERAGTAADLFLTDDPAQALRLAQLLERQNARRREIEMQIREEAIRIVEGTGAARDHRVLVLSAPDWHPGVIGIVAAKVAERYARPALLISTGREPGKGSARSVGETNIYVELCRARHLFTALGGHAHAAGFSIREEDIPALRRELNPVSPEGAAAASGERRIDIDADLDFADLRPALADELRRLAPFGHGNPEPAFATRAVRLAQSPRTVGSNHLRLTLLQRPHARSFIGFNLGGFAGDLAAGLGIDIAYDLDLEGGSRGGWERYRLRDIRIPYDLVPPSAPG